MPPRFRWWSPDPMRKKTESHWEKFGKNNFWMIWYHVLIMCWWFGIGKSWKIIPVQNDQGQGHPYTLPASEEFSSRFTPFMARSTSWRSHRFEPTEMKICLANGGWINRKIMENHGKSSLKWVKTQLEKWWNDVILGINGLEHLRLKYVLAKAEVRPCPNLRPKQWYVCKSYIYLQLRTKTLGI